MKTIPMKNKIAYWLFLLFLPGVYMSLPAQTGRDSLQSQTVTVVKSYTPTIRDADKISVNPDLEEESDFTKIPVSYHPLDIEAVSTYQAEKGKLLRPRITAGKMENLPGYAEFAAGNEKAFRLKGFYAYELPSDWVVGGGASFWGLGKTYRDSTALAPYYDWRLEGFAKHQNTFRKWHFNAGYAGRHAVFRDTLPPFDDLGDAFTAHRVQADARGVFYEFPVRNAGLQYRFYSGYGAAENRLHLNSDVVFPVAGFDIRTRVTAALTAGQAGEGYTNFQTGIFPALQLEQKSLLFTLGLKAFYQNRNDVASSFLIYPDVRVDYHMIPEYLTLYLRYEGDVYTRSYDEMSLQNTFVVADTALQPTTVPYHFSGGFTGSIGTRMNYNLNLGMARAQNYPFLQLQSTEAGLGFVPVYDRLDYFYFKVHLSYVAGENFETKLKFDYYQNKPEHLPKAWNMEDYKISWLLRGKWEKFGFRSDLYYIGPRYNVWNGQTVNTGEIVDWNLRLSYGILPGMDIYVEGNNLLHRKDMIYYPYPVHGLHVLAGVTYSFR